MMKQLFRPVQFIYFIYAAISFVCLLLIITPLVIIASFFGKQKGGNFIYSLCTAWSAIWMFMIGIRPRIIYEQSHDSKKQYIFVANHWSYMDVPMTVNAIRQPFRALGKYELSKLPIFGFLYRNAVVMVDRSSPANRAKSVQVLKSVLKSGISVIIFPEGTFNMTQAPLKEFFDGAFRIAIETQTAIKPIIFPDTLARYGNEHIWSLSPGKCRAVFLREVPVEGLTIKDLPALKTQVYQMMEERLLYYKNDFQ
jgi:1-acyl-sn-glycerol-3-phosphate acyltransferase